MNLVDFSGAELLRRVFSYSPTIEKIDLFDISLKRDGKLFMANFDLIDQLPDRPPEKWKNFNRCRVGIHCAVVSELKISGWNARNLASLHIDKAEDGYDVQFFGEAVQIHFICQFISLIGPTVYLDGE